MSKNYANAKCDKEDKLSFSMKNRPVAVMIIRDVRHDEFIRRAAENFILAEDILSSNKIHVDPVIHFMPIRVGNPTLRTGSRRSLSRRYAAVIRYRWHAYTHTYV